MSNLDDAIAENTAFDLLEMRQDKRAKVKQHDSVQIGTIGSADTRTPIAAILALKHFNQMVEQVNEK